MVQGLCGSRDDSTAVEITGDSEGNNQQAQLAGQDGHLREDLQVGTPSGIQPALRHTDHPAAQTINQQQRPSMTETFQRRELMIIRIIAVTMVIYVVIAAPICIMNVVDPCVQQPNYRSVFYSIYVWMYVLNFFIIARAHPVFKDYCIMFARKAMTKFSRSTNEAIVI
jgi:hypothetical protein